MKSYIKQIIGIILTIVPPIAIIVCVLYFTSDKYLINSYYQMAVNNYMGISSYNIETDSTFSSSESVYLFENEKYYKVNNYESLLKKYKGEALEEFKIYTNIKEFGGNYYSLPYNTNNVEGYMEEYTYEKVDSSFSKKTYKITSYFCDTSDIDVNCSIEDDMNVYKVETEFTIERNGLTWQIVNFKMPEAKPEYTSSYDYEDEIDESINNESNDIEYYEPFIPGQNTDSE